MTLCELITKPITRMVEEGKNLDQIAEAICPTIIHGREKIIRVIRDFLGEEYLVQNSTVLGYDVGKAQLAKKRRHQKIDATTDTVVESSSVTPASCQTTVQTANAELVKEAQAKEAGQGKGQEQALEEHDKSAACCQERSKSVRKKRDSERDSEKETTGQVPNDAPVENKFDELVEAVKKLIGLFSLDEVKKAFIGHRLRNVIISANIVL